MFQDWTSHFFEVVRTEEHADKTAGRAGFRLKASGKRLWQADPGTPRTMGSFEPGSRTQIVHLSAT